MSVNKFKFVSPGVFIDEIDQSQLPAEPAKMGPVIIGRAERGPAMKPVTVNSFLEFVEIFGDPIPGGKADDVWRNGNYSGPTYGAFAAQAYLRNNSPITFIRLLGKQDVLASATLSAKGMAGWNTSNQVTATHPDSGGAYGLFVIESGSCNLSDDVEGDGASIVGTFRGQELLTGTLAAVWYMNEGFAELSGTYRDDYETAGTTEQTTGSCVMVQSLGGTRESTEFKVILKGTDASNIIDTAFNFDPSSSKYIRKVFNTNPMLTNSDIYSTTKKYWLGETFERAVGEKLTGDGAGKAFGFIIGLSSGSSGTSQYEYSKQRKESINAETGWIISQDLANVTSGEVDESFSVLDQNRLKRLFKFIALDTGEWNQKNLKVSVVDIKPAKSDKTWPTFAIEVRRITDHDKNKQVVEKYSNLNMNPSSPNYIARRVGTRFTTWNATDRRLEYHGDYENVSKFMRVVMHEDSPTREHMPFGAYGPIRFAGFTVRSGSAFVGDAATEYTFGEASANVSRAHASSSDAAGSVSVGEHVTFTGSYEYPGVALRISASAGGIIDDTKAYFGADTTKRADGNVRFEESVIDCVRSLPGQTKDTFDIVDSPIVTGHTNAERSWVFTLDDISYDNTTKRFHYASGSRKLGNSWTAISGTTNLLTSSDAGINKFTTVFYGGFDGLDIKEREPFRNEDVLSLQDETTSYAYHTLMRAIDIVRDPEQVECNLMAIPGVTDRKITERLVRTCEERADALAIIDIENDFVPDTENTSDDATRLGNVAQAVNSMKDRELDSSYGAAYYPWVQVKDRESGVMLWCPPSVVALGAMAYSEAVRNVWFAPAGFSRGGLTATGAGGLTVTGVRQHLTSKQRDKLYDVNVNPIASFPAEGIVIFGQKTLQLTPSALDRINVRRLLIFLKKEISRVASQTLFEQNVKDTWNGFSGHVDKILNDVRVNFGLADYKLVLDETTTTPELIDRNIMYAKIFLKPARAIEFIALDFIITSSGASFED